MKKRCREGYCSGAGEEEETRATGILSQIVASSSASFCLFFICLLFLDVLVHASASHRSTSAGHPM